MPDKPYGPYVQNAYIVPDLDAAIDHWVKVMNVGPFFKFPPLEFPTGIYRGQPETIRFNAAIAYSGDLQIELIQAAGPSIFQEAHEAGQNHVHHLCVMANDAEAAIADFEKRGGECIQRFSLEDGSICAYIDMHGADGLIVEIAYMKEEVTQLFAALKQKAAEWDGVTPLVEF
ncbi:Glyoxalase/Bleomycin resistance protein/Dioxygenase superfamily protein [Sphingobium faniae]|nr:Glyoxalase/Bleomycin resistance protein/Dioxygenase superfamily protein [Sphingobium faniae]